MARQRCEECGGRFGQPGQYHCDSARHPKPDQAWRIVLLIEDDLNDRKGLGLDLLDDDILDEIREMWARKIRDELRL